MTFPVKVEYKGAVAKVYAPAAGFSYYRVSFRTDGKRRMLTFSTYTEAKTAAKDNLKNLHKGHKASALTAAQARDALAALERLEAYRKTTGKHVSLNSAVSGFCESAMRLHDVSLSDAVAGYLGTVATVTRKDIAEAVAEFVAAREEKTKAADGKRAQLSATYTYNTGLWLGWFAKMFPATAVCDLVRKQMDLFMAGRSHLAPKSKNHLRATLRMFLGWCVKRDYLPKTHRLLEAESMERETLTGGDTDFYRPSEFRAMLDAADNAMRPIIALQGLAGIRLQEAQRLTWADVFGTPGHVAISATKAKTRSRRLVEICPALAQWLKPHREQEGPLWTGHRDTWHAQFTKLREGLKLDGRKKVPARKNGLRHAFCTYHFALHGNENLTAAQAGNSPGMIHQAYKGLATKAEAEQWFAVLPPAEADNVIQMPAAANR